MTKVLFVCLGNICRSPMAEGLLKKYSEEQELDLFIDSAATSHWEAGNPPYPGTQNIFRRERIDFTGMYSRQIESADFSEFDWIIGMDCANIKELKRRAPKGTEDKIHLYMDVVPGKKNQEIPDPWITGDFDETYQMLSEGLPFWVEQFTTNS